MRRLLFLLILLCLLISEERASGQPASPTLKIYSRLVLMDANVTDAKGMPIHGLTHSDFHILDNNKLQKISSLEEHAVDPKTLPIVANAAAPATVTLDVKNMTCATCPITIKKSLEKVFGVTAVKVDYGKKTATVTYDPDKTKPDQLTHATTDAGFPSTVRK